MRTPSTVISGQSATENKSHFSSTRKTQFLTCDSTTRTRFKEALLDPYATRTCLRTTKIPWSCRKQLLTLKHLY